MSPANLAPEWLKAEKLKIVTKEYYDRLSFELKKEIKIEYDEVITQDRIEAYYNFLNGSGKAVWLKYIEDVSFSKNRDFQPFTPNEQETIENAFTNAFHFKPEHNYIYRKAQIHRIMISLLFLLIGFSLIIATYWFLPEISHKMAVERKLYSGLETNKLAELKDELSKVNFLAMQTKVDKVHSTLSGSDKLIIAMEDISKIANNITNNINTHKKSFEAQIDNFRKTNDQATSSIEFRTYLEQQITELNMMSSKIGPTINAKLTDDIRAQLSNTEEIINQLNNIKNDYFIRDKIKNILKKHPDLSTEIKKNLSLIPNTIISDVTIDQINFTQNTEKLQEWINNQLDLLSKLESLISNINNWSENISILNDNITTKIKGDNNTDISLLSLITAVQSQVDDLNTITESSKDIINNIDSATSKIDEFSKVQADFATRASSPGIILIFAIGGMFVTFGMSSMLKYVKNIDMKSYDDQWQERTSFYSKLSLALISHGIDPTKLIDRLQATPVKPDTEKQIIKTPISETIGEIVNIIKTKS